MAVVLEIGIRSRECVKAPFLLITEPSRRSNVPWDIRNLTSPDDLSNGYVPYDGTWHDFIEDFENQKTLGCQIFFGGSRGFLLLWPPEAGKTHTKLWMLYMEQPEQWPESTLDELFALPSIQFVAMSSGDTLDLEQIEGEINRHNFPWNHYLFLSARVRD